MRRDTAAGSCLTRAAVVPARSVGSGLGVPQSYLDALGEAGIAAVIVTEARSALELLSAAGGLLLPGGADVSPGHYGATAHPTTKTEEGLDDLELALTTACLQLGKPMLAICRGIQVLNVALGGTLVQDLPSEHPSEVGHGGARAEDGSMTDDVHDLRVAAGSQLERLLPAAPVVNSHHHQALERLGDGLVATAWASDGVVEAVELPGRSYVAAVQFHPERMEEKVRVPLFSAFADAIGAASGA